MKKMNSLLKVLFISTLSFSASSLQAAPYVSGQVGFYGQGNNNFVDNLFNHNSDRQLTGRVAGGYEWEMDYFYNIGLEVGLNGYKNASVAIGHTELNLTGHRASADLLGVVNVFATPEINVFAKGGFAYVKQKFPAHYQNTPFISIHESNVVPKVEIGTGYNLLDNVNVNFSLNHEFKNSDFAPAASALLVGVQYSFI